MKDGFRLGVPTSDLKAHWTCGTRMFIKTVFKGISGLSGGYVLVPVDWRLKALIVKNC